jgi:hypothetical protein
MFKYFFIAFIVTSTFFVEAQTKKPNQKKTGAKTEKKDSVKPDVNIPSYQEIKVPRSFFVYTKRPKTKADQMQLCINLMYKDSALYQCFNDSICKDPHTTKILFEQLKGDTNYVLVLVDAFTNMKSDPGKCSAGKETKLFFVRWNVKDNKAKWKQKTINSCYKTVTDMTKEPIADWDKTSVLTINYHKGPGFYEVKFDPQNAHLGLQSNKDSEGK